MVGLEDSTHPKKGSTGRWPLFVNIQTTAAGKTVVWSLTWSEFDLSLPQSERVSVQFPSPRAPRGPLVCTAPFAALARLARPRNGSVPPVPRLEKDDLPW
jgi:hypothetical protein